MSQAVLPGVFTVAEAARHAGVSPWKIRLEIKEGRIHAAYIGRCIRILDEELGRYLRECMTSSPAGRDEGASTPPDDSLSTVPAGGEVAVAS